MGSLDDFTSGEATRAARPPLNACFALRPAGSVVAFEALRG
jgi:hypothetical protein